MLVLTLTIRTEVGIEVPAIGTDLLMTYLLQTTASNLKKLKAYFLPTSYLELDIVVP